MKHGENLLDDPVAWGRELILTHDHDPLYTGLVRWNEREGDGDRLRRFMVAYWCCYSVGASWFISQHEGDAFWDWLETAAHNINIPPPLLPLGSSDPTPQPGCGTKPHHRWPRAHERRHWRGEKSWSAVEWLQDKYARPEDMVIELENLPGDINLRAVELAVTAWPQFGPWIAFKAADMMERILGVPVAFPDAITTMYRDPRKGADMMGPLLGGRSAQDVTHHLLDSYEDLPAPPLGDRSVNVQEVETVLCKWKSARNGKYHIGADSASHKAELELWGGQELFRCYPSDPA